VRKGGNTELQHKLANGQISPTAAAWQVIDARPKLAFKLIPLPQDAGPATVRQWKDLGAEQR
jgi:hypothetical protein